MSVESTMDRDQSTLKRRAFLFAGGGTGGHIYPALAIIEQLRLSDPDVDVSILCSTRPVDHEILSKHDVDYDTISAMPISTRPGGMIRFIKSWNPSVSKTQKHIRRLKETNDEVILVAMGGFVAAPAAKAGHKENVPVVLVNLDAIPGKANVLIGKRATGIYSAAQIEGFKNWQRVRPIVRQSTLSIQTKGESRRAFDLDEATNTLLITGGSQGATSINHFVEQMIIHRPESLLGWQVIHQVGGKLTEDEIETLRAIYDEAGINAWVERYIDSMGNALNAADLGVARCGAGSVAECWASKLPVVFFPYPYHKDEHQRHNAAILSNAGAALILTDHVDAQQNLEAHHKELMRLLQNESSLRQMSRAYEELPTPDGADAIAKGLMGDRFPS
ncbi:MAG: UDP-N-acetylglucosamine--N-acetylmuramyl-(pentapeptide) pyrophosphoryl-undecaprenol N-acetylglucosamine transferase [Phycisphaerales bacterium]|nr:UDP-N-acetylglucosamine--N-acetylmuramyl-(pentapeptide) pyrophosphoryl-undecaprenol N-acetylglucosamine transferase [Phycisphaerales bacterium]